MNASYDSGLAETPIIDETHVEETHVEETHISDSLGKLCTSPCVILSAAKNPGIPHSADCVHNDKPSCAELR